MGSASETDDGRPAEAMSSFVEKQTASLVLTKQASLLLTTVITLLSWY